MRLGYQDKTGGLIHEFKKRDGRKDLFNGNADYVGRFFDDVKGLGNVFIVLIKGNKVRRIASRTF